MERIAILGISAYYHDSAAAIIINGEIIAAAQEERFSRIKHDSGFPKLAINYVLEESGIPFSQLKAVVFYDKPLLKFERLLETYHAFAPSGFRSFITAMPVWLKEKLFMRKQLQRQLASFGKLTAPLLFSDHHLSHSASAFYPSPFERAAIITVDGVGEWATATIGIGTHNEIRILKEMHFPHSVGLLYSAFTYFLGFKVNSGEYKLMGLAPYGDPDAGQTQLFKEKILTHMVDIREDGSIILNMKYFRYATQLRMIDNGKWTKLFGFPRREPESEILQEHMNLALAIQQVIETILIKLGHYAKELTGAENLVLAGGVALNCVANAKIALTGLFRNIWIQPAAGDAGGSLGSALATYHIYFGKERKVSPNGDCMNHSYLGPSYTESEIQKTLNTYEAEYILFEKTDELIEEVSSKLADGKIIGWFQGRMEFGPRALGNRSILADPRNHEIQRTLNLKTKFREGFRPFAPSVLEEDASDYFSLPFSSSPYMLLTAQIKEKWQLPKGEEEDLYGRLYHPRSIVPAVTHVDYSARVQTVSKESNPLFWSLLQQFKKETGIGMLINTSFNVRGEPIVCTPENAYVDFMSSEMDYLVLGNYLLDRTKQRSLTENQKTKIQTD